jgi:GT2 family glycosyltransferase
MVLRREVWRDLDGFAPEYFAYHEDTDLSLRCWQHGLAVVYVPDAVVVHRYASGRSKAKFYLLERNRLITLFTTFEGPTLLALLPLVVAVELGVLALAVREGWARRKLAGWWWLVRHGRWQAARKAPDRAIAPRLASRLPSEVVEIPRAAQSIDRLFAGYWRWVARRVMSTNSL